MALIDLLNKVATNLLFLENAISAKCEKGSAIKKGMPVSLAPYGNEYLFSAVQRSLLCQFGDF